ncbi:zinc finger protein 532 [Patella vulgata]|uniref:zinc finger protein 532 n=1 Tax=Patella vulgata TaxID=6465 RepID=UPI00217FAF69|nr:zinc finger protein 532 [Patella vulgata]
MDPENMDQKSEDKICEMEAMNEIKEAEIKRQSTNEELDREMKSNISNVCESKESVNDNYEESENISYQLINLESEVEKSSFPENSTTDQNEKSGKCSEDTNCMKSGLEAKDKQTGISILNTSLVESTNSAEFLQSVDSQSSTIKISEEASFQMNRAPDHFEDREEPNKTDDLTKLQTLKTTHPEMMKLDEQNVIECHTSEDVDNDKLKVDTGRKDIDDDKLKVETGSKDNDNDKLEVETGSKDNDNDKLEVETGIEDTDSDKLKVDTGSEGLNSDKLEVDSEDIDKGNDKMKVDTASENIDKDNDKLKVDTGSEDLDNDKLKVETGSEDKGDEVLEEINKGEKHSQDEIMDQPNFASNQSEKTPIRRITPKPTISDQIDAFNRCFGSTDSDSDCDKLVLDYKTQGSESCTSGAETDVDLHGNKTTKLMMYSKSELMKDTLIPPVCNETETEDNQRSQKEELKNRMMDEKDESVRNNLMKDGMSRDSTIDTDESVSTEQSVYPNFKPIIDVQSPPRTSKDDELKGTSGNDLAQISKDLEMEDQKMSYLNDGKTFSDELKPEKISMAVDGDENQVSLNLKSEDTLAGSGLSTNTPNRPDSRPETEMETQSIPEFSPTLNIIAGVQITPEEFEKIETENDLSFSSKNESYEDGSISESEIQSVAVKISEPAPILASILDKQVPKVSSTVSERVNAPETNATKLTGMITKIKTEPVDEGYPSASSFNVSKINVAGNGKPTPIPLAIQSSSLMPYSSSSSSLSSSSTVTPRFSLSENSNLVSRLKVKKVTNTAQIAGPRIIRVPNPRPPYQELNIQPKRQENGNVGRKPTPRYGGTKIVRITQATANKQLGPKVKKNFDSFDIASVTDILQRKHKIGNHKAPPILMRYKDYLKDFTVSSCLECGDSFTSREMLSFHRNRVSVEISYKCPLCMNVVIFYNKCSFLNHIRIHNTERAQSKNPAIQVKADILSIRLAPYKMMLETLEKPIPTIEISDKPRPRPPQNLGSCTECGKVCDTNLSLAEHFGSGEVICSFAHVCNMCNMIFPRQCALEAHKRYHSNQMPYTCPECGLVVGEINEFRKHLHTKCFHFTRAGLLRCFRNLWKPCGHTDIRLNSFIKHLHTHHATKMNECAVTKSPSGEEKTVTTTIVACGICNTVLRNPVKMKEHMNIHVKEVKRNATFVYVCTNCPVSSCGLNLSMYTSKKDLEDHYRSKHREYFKMPPNVRSLICSACSTVTGSYSKFLEHQLQAHEMINAEFYFCQQCKCMFENPDILSIHTCHPKVFTIAKHSENYGEPQKLCEIAPKPAVNSPPRISLKSPPKPMNKSPPKPVSKVQPKKLVQLQPKPPAKVPNLVIKLVPKAPEKHECLFCHKEFKNKDEKEKHSQSEHSSFPCHLCGLTYKTQLNLDEHVQATHEGSKPGFFCLPCKKKGITRTFVKAGVLEKHLIFKHRIAKARLKRFIAVGKESSKSDKLKRKTLDELESVPVKRLRVEGSGVYTCVKCNFNTEDSSEFSAHIETHKTTDTTQCPECGLCFSVLPSLKKHLFMVHKIRNADEYISEKGIEEPEEMDVDDEEDDLLEVTISPRKTPFTDIAPSEPIRKKNGPIGELECRVCYREFESVNLLKNHMRVHGMAFIRSRRLTPSESDGCKTDKEEPSP